MQHPTARMLWLALLATQLVYVVVAFTVRLAGSPPDATFVRHMAIALAVIAAVEAVGTIVYRRRALVAPIREGRLDPSSAEGFARLLPPYVVVLTLTESIAIYGLVLAFLSRDARLCLPFALGALALMYVHRPWAPDLAPPLMAPSSYRPPPIA